MIKMWLWMCGGHVFIYMLIYCHCHHCHHCCHVSNTINSTTINLLVYLIHELKLGGPAIVVVVGCCCHHCCHWCLGWGHDVINAGGTVGGGIVVIVRALQVRRRKTYFPGMLGMLASLWIGRGWYRPCLRSSDATRSEPNWAKAETSQYWVK